MKLELKHLAPYLPYQLKCKLNDFDEEKIAELNAIYSDNTYTFCSIVESEKGFADIKPILRPLSNLTKEIEHNGEKFVPIEILSKWTTCEYEDDVLKYATYNSNGEIDMEEINVLDLEYHQIVKLFEWHFDCFGLIENGLAIDINTLKK